MRVIKTLKEGFFLVLRLCVLFCSIELAAPSSVTCWIFVSRWLAHLIVNSGQLIAFNYYYLSGYIPNLAVHTYIHFSIHEVEPLPYLIVWFVPLSSRTNRRLLASGLDLLARTGMKVPHSHSQTYCTSAVLQSTGYEASIFMPYLWLLVVPFECSTRGPEGYIACQLL